MRTAATSRHDQCSARPKLASANTAASTTNSVATIPKMPATTIHALARRREVIFSVISVFASCNSFCTSSARSARRSVKVRVRPEFCMWSSAMELARSPAEGFMAAIAEAAAFGRVALEHAEVFRRAALEHAEREETRERCQGEHAGRLPTGELRCRSHQILYGLPADVARELLHALGRTASEARELRSVRVEAVGGATHGPRDVAGQVGAARDLHIQEAFGLLAGVGRQRSGGV